MGSQTLSILRQGIWASLTGGWYYDPKQSHAANVFHLYVWLLLLSLPIITQLGITGQIDGGSFGRDNSLLLWSIYCIIIAVIFVGIKFTNLYLHSLFDVGECVVEESTDEVELEDEEVDREREAGQDNDSGSGRRRRRNRIQEPSSAEEGFELLPMRERTTSATSRSSTAREGHANSSRRTSSPSSGPPAYLVARILSTPGMHLSSAHDDTSAGAVHCFQDEFGNWLTYTFNGDGSAAVSTDLLVGDASIGGDVASVSRKSVKDSQSQSSRANVLTIGSSNKSFEAITSDSISPSTSARSMIYDSPTGTGQNPATSSLVGKEASSREPLPDRRHSTSLDKTRSSKSIDKSVSKIKKTTVSLEVYPTASSSQEDVVSGTSSKSSSVIDLRSESLSLGITKEEQENEVLTGEGSLFDEGVETPVKKEVTPEQTTNKSVLNSPGQDMVIEDEPHGPLEVSSIEVTVMDRVAEKTEETDSKISPPILSHPVEVVSANSIVSISSRTSSRSSSQSYETSLIMPSRVHVIHSPVNQGASTSTEHPESSFSRRFPHIDSSSLLQPFSTFSPVHRSNLHNIPSSSGRAASSAIEVPSSSVVLSASSSQHQHGFHSFTSSFNTIRGGNNSHPFNFLNTTTTLHELSLSGMRFPDFNSPELPPKPKQYYKLWIPPCFRWTFIKVRLDRLQLLALLDNNISKFELLASITLGIMVAILGSVIISLGIFRDIPFFVFCFVMSSCQYTLIKSVQPDAASPTHGYNRTIIFSRPIYFSISSLIIIGCHFFLQDEERKNSLNFTLFRMNILSASVIQTLFEASKVFILFFPLIFSFGLLPQVDTFAIYLLEQFEIHIFGGTAATTGLTSAVYSFCRSLLTLTCLYGIALVSLYRVYHSAKRIKGEFTYHSYDVAFSIYCGIMTSMAYLLSRSSSDPTVLFRLLKKLGIFCVSCITSIGTIHKRRKLAKQLLKTANEVEMKEIAKGDGSSREGSAAGKGEEIHSEEGDARSQEYHDPLPETLDRTLIIRLQNDLIICIVTAIVVFATHVSTIFTLQPIVEYCLACMCIGWGFILHYFMKQSRKELPWLCFSQPFLKPREWDLFEVKDEARLMCFERFQAWLWLIEKNALYPLFFLSALTKDTPILLDKFGFWVGSLFVVLTGFKAIRSSLNDSSHNYIILIFAYLLFEFDLKSYREAFLLNYFVSSILYWKVSELLLKMKFVVTYVAPWQITWGSAFHAFAQPFSVPHSAMLVVQAIVSSLLSSPLQPVLGSAIFLTSYVRPVKFWERDYNTKRVDHSNLRLASQLERSQLGNDDNNLNSIFYEHLTRSLQTSLYGDLALGRWGQVSQGDCFILASDNLNCLVHIIELANGLVTFQVRGLEFRGTYCQQREVEALSEGVSEDEGCCCCEPGHLPSMLSINAAFNQRWLAWEVTHTKYVLEGYSISDNSAVSMLQPYDLRKALITYYCKSVIFYTISNKRLRKWIDHKSIMESLEGLKEPQFVDLDPIFNLSVDEDFDYRASGITRASFCRVYLDWIKFCLIQRRNQEIQRTSGSASGGDADNLDLDEDKVTILCFALSLIARRSLSAASHNNAFASVEFLLFGLHALFKGDFRITSSRDEWVFQDMELLKQVIAPAVRMAVKLHQDHFMSADDYDNHTFLYMSIVDYEKNIVISHEADPVWRNAVLSNVPSLLALRHVFDEGSDKYKFVMLNRRYLSFRVIKVNKECVRGLWAGQQQELIYLRNRNPERGSIQNAKQALRNIINSSCDQPIGYPIYVSPLTTSFAETNEQLTRVIGRSFSFDMFKIAALRFWTRTKVRFGQACPSALQDDEVLTPFGPDITASVRRHPVHQHLMETPTGHFHGMERNFGSKFLLSCFESKQFSH